MDPNLDFQQFRERLSRMRKVSMRLGTMVGIYYALKFCLFPLSFSHAFAGLLFIVLTVLVPFVVGALVKRYRLSLPEEAQMTYPHAWSFTLRVFFFASLLAVVAHYVYFAYIDHGALLQAVTDSLDQMSALQVEGVTDQVTWQKQMETFRESFESVAALTPIQLTMELFVNNLFWGFILALPIAALNAKKARFIDKN